MAETLETQFLRADLEVDCPGCGYRVWVTGAEVVAQAAVTCPCCRARTWILDADGSFQNAGRVIEQQGQPPGRQWPQDWRNDGREPGAN